MDTMKSSMIRSLRRMIVRPLRRFAINKKGTAAIEFAIVALPFFALLFAIIETGIVFLADQTLETAVSDSARLILTGQAQNGGMDQAAFKDTVCKDIHGLFDCAKLSVDVRTFTNFSSIDVAAPTDANGNFDSSNMQYNAGQAGDIVLVRLFYQFPIANWLWNPNIVTNAHDGTRLIIAAAAFRNEPYGP